MEANDTSFGLMGSRWGPWLIGGPKKQTSSKHVQLGTGEEYASLIMYIEYTIFFIKKNQK